MSRTKLKATLAGADAEATGALAGERAASARPAAGRLGEFCLQKEVGRGGMGVG